MLLGSGAGERQRTTVKLLVLLPSRFLAAVMQWQMLELWVIGVKFFAIVFN